jgi:hypothetical protein
MIPHLKMRDLLQFVGQRCGLDPEIIGLLEPQPHLRA